MSDKVLIERELLERIVNAPSLTDEGEAIDKLRALLSEQSQAAPDEAVAQWQSMSCGEGGRWFNIADSDAEQAKSDGFEVRALYTHPAPSQPSGRVELSRQFVDAVKQLCKDFSDLQNRPYMGDVYAALDGLLEHEQIPVAATPHPEQPQASAAQSAPAGEREAFEAWYRQSWGYSENAKFAQDERSQYTSAHIHESWVVWQAGASWQRTQSAPEGAGLDGLPLVIAGAIFDFAGFLTTREGVIEVGANANASPVADLIQEWAELRGLSLADASVLSWQDLLAAAPAQPAAQEHEDSETLRLICEIFGIGEKARTRSAILANVENTHKFASMLHAIEGEFFMVPGEIDPDYPDDQPYDCLVNCWASSVDQYVEQFREALKTIAAHDQGEVQRLREAEELLWLAQKHFGDQKAIRSGERGASDRQQAQNRIFKWLDARRMERVAALAASTGQEV